METQMSSNGYSTKNLLHCFFAITNIEIFASKADGAFTNIIKTIE